MSLRVTATSVITLCTLAPKVANADFGGLRGKMDAARNFSITAAQSGNESVRPLLQMAEGSQASCILLGEDCGQIAPDGTCCDDKTCEPWWSGDEEGRPNGYKCANASQTPQPQCVPAGENCGTADNTAPLGNCCDDQSCEAWWTGSAEGRPSGYKCAKAAPTPQPQCVPAGGNCGNSDHSAPLGNCCDGQTCEPWWPSSHEGRPYGYKCVSPTHECLQAGVACNEGDHCCGGMSCLARVFADGSPAGSNCAFP